jgi:5-methylthioadenosine/S-adenosylhomocysteine deaminase
MMARTLIKPGTIVTMDAGRRLISRGAVIVRGSAIEAVIEDSAQVRGAFEGEVIDAPSEMLIPGFIQTHIHLCQTLFRGLAEQMDLLDWLRLRIFPYEAAHTASSMAASASLGLAELIRSGTTTIMDMGAIHHEDEIVRAVSEWGMRAFVGKSLMDLNDLYPPYRQPADASLRETLRQAEQWHGSSDGRIRYAVAPRFVLSCSERLLRDAFAMTMSFDGMLLHTHAAENRRELDAVRKRCAEGNIAYFDSLGMLDARTCLAHCVWLDPSEIGRIADKGARVLHCPTSNAKLGSGIAPVPECLSRGISVSLGADGAPCNGTLDMFQEMRLASLMQSARLGPAALPPERVFAMATLGGAAALGIDHETGSVEPGKKADLVLLNLHSEWNPSIDTDPYATIVHTASPENVRSVMIDGRWVYRDRSYVAMDEIRVREQAARELRQLLERVETTG